MYLSPTNHYRSCSIGLVRSESAYSVLSFSLCNHGFWSGCRCS
uniref:Uncharacterized protein n=1 Tax=Utricularia reniformis TaxID=192314 RepID=A0A1Y0B3Y8_9LAMI|nr:hypothetical protein AEK19_MT1938 [Utricularia reniformis]ART32103.1 hypothetical protein AEK19_MT1938 [Utricularia reniformis]